MNKKIILASCIAIFALIAVMGAVVFGDMSKSSDEVMTGPKKTEHVITKQMEEYGFSVDKETKEKAANLDSSNIKDISTVLENIGVKGQKNRNLSEALALMGLSYGQIKTKKAEEVDEEGLGIPMTKIWIEVKEKEHSLVTFFDIDKNRTIRFIYDETGESVYGFDEENVLFAKDLNVYYL